MWSGCRRVDLVVSQAYPGMTKCILAFLHLRQSSNEDVDVSINKIHADSNCSEYIYSHCLRFRRSQKL